MPAGARTLQSPETLRRLAGHLQELAANVRRLASDLTDAKLESISVSGQTRLLKAMGDMDRFLADARNSLREAMNERGDFCVSEPMASVR